MFGRSPTAIRTGNFTMLRLIFRRGAPLLAVATWAALATSTAMAQADQRNLVTDATVTLSNFLNDPDMTWLHRNVKRAKAVLVAPQITKAGFILGGSGGRGVVVARDAKSGKWVGPAFYTLATASIGFQAGVSVSEVVTLVMTDKGMNSLLSDSVKLGGDAAVAAGPVGAGAQSNLSADFVSFSRATGVYGGINFDGTVISTADAWNRAYYGQKVHAPDILVRMTVRNKQANELLNIIAAAAKK
jgi:lipid-binding SYLF domain-containing protein